MNLKKIIFGGFLALSLFSTNAMAVPTTSPDVLGQSLVEYAEKLIHRAKEYVEWAREETADIREATNTVTSKVQEGLQWIQQQERDMKNWLDESGLTEAYEKLDGAYDTYNEVKNLYERAGVSFDDMKNYIDGDSRRIDLLKNYFSFDNFDGIAKTCDKSDFKLSSSDSNTLSSGCASKWTNRFVYISGLTAAKKNIEDLNERTRKVLKKIAESEDTTLTSVGGSGMVVGSSTTTVSGGSMKKTADYQSELMEIQTHLLAEQANIMALKQDFDLKEKEASELERKEIAKMAADKAYESRQKANKSAVEWLQR